MIDNIDISEWPEEIRRRYEDYLKTSFFFSDTGLRNSFQEALREEGRLLKVCRPEAHSEFEQGSEARSLAKDRFGDDAEDLLPALSGHCLYSHQDQAIRNTHFRGRNVFVATGTASGKTESFLYPILFELYRQYLEDTLEKPGVRAMILYPMNALANDQRERLGLICDQLKKAGSQFKPTFGQYTGQTPENIKNRYRNAAARNEERRTGELVFREEMRKTPPHILLTNYSMLEYLLIRPEDSCLFDRGRGTHWQFLVLDEAHQYRGTKGMEMGMLIRRLKQRLRDGGRRDSFQCIATSATISRNKEGDDETAIKSDKKAVSEFAGELFGEKFLASDVIFGKFKKVDSGKPARRYHAFMRALEGAFLVHKEGKDFVALNRKQASGNGHTNKPLEIALCRECGQHYYVGKSRDGKLQEAVRDPSQTDFGVDYYLPTELGDEILCRSCGALSKRNQVCDCKASILVKKCKSHKEHRDRLKECAVCSYQGGDPVQEIVHGSDGPNSVIATALHRLLPDEKRKVLAFADNRQEAAFFAWYAENSYEKLRDRNFMFQAVMSGDIDEEGLSINLLQNRLLKQYDKTGLFSESDVRKEKDRRVLTSILREAMTSEKRLSLSGVGLVKWFVALPRELNLPKTLQQPPWTFNEKEAYALVGYLLDEMRSNGILNLPEEPDTPSWHDISDWSRIQPSFARVADSRHNVRQWGGPTTSVVQHFLYRLLENKELSEGEKKLISTELMEEIWDALREVPRELNFLIDVGRSGAFRLDSRWVRIKPVHTGEIWECNTCATLSSHNVRNICPRNRCPGMLRAPDQDRLEGNHYRKLYETISLPAKLSAKEHTAQINPKEARERQDEFKKGNIHLLSSSTTFEVGVDLGDLESVFLRNVPPEPFNYTQRAGRAGRREGNPGLVLTYCRRNPHDLYHYENPEDRILKGEIRPPRLHMRNEKIILRHMIAVALSSFFKENEERFNSVEKFVGDWYAPQGVDDLRVFCKNNDNLKKSLCRIVPKNMYDATGLNDDSWVEKIVGQDSRFEEAEAEVCTDYIEIEKLYGEHIEQKKFRHLSRLQGRQNTIAKEKTLNFLSRKAVIPKYGFPVDVVELDVCPTNNGPTNVVLQRDLSQAIAEYAPGGKVVADKLEWKSYGLKKVAGKEWPESYYRYDKARDFKKLKAEGWKYIVPKFGFVTSLLDGPSEPKRQAQRLYTTRPFFYGFSSPDNKEEKSIFDIKMTKAAPGMLVILCEGKNREGFFICYSCGAQMVDRKASHNSPSGSKCSKSEVECVSLGHELVTDVMRLQFPNLWEESDAYSVAYAILLGAAETLEVLDTDLNVTTTGVQGKAETAVVLYDNVPGGAGLVAQLEDRKIFEEVLLSAKQRVSGGCGCDSSCYGCLRSYRNQFAHPYLDRNKALKFLTTQGQDNT